MLPSDMNLNIRSGTVGYNNKILVSDGKFNLGKNDKVDSLKPAVSKISHSIIQISQLCKLVIPGFLTIR